MRFFLFVASQESDWANKSQEQKDEIVGKYLVFTAQLVSAGVYLAGNSLQPTSKGVRVAVRNGERTVTEGPFADPQGAVGGYYLIDVKSKEEAIEWAAKSPGAEYGTIEVREVSQMNVPGMVGAGRSLVRRLVDRGSKWLT